MMELRRIKSVDESGELIPEVLPDLPEPPTQVEVRVESEAEIEAEIEALEARLEARLEERMATARAELHDLMAKNKEPLASMTPDSNRYQQPLRAETKQTTHERIQNHFQVEWKGEK